MAMEHGDGLEALTRFATELIRDLGEEALSFYGNRRTHLKFDDELVTQAEIRLLDMFETRIQNQFPVHQVYKNSQEIKAYTHGAEKFLWVFDAIDGVSNFQAGIPIWGMSIALLENFWPIFGTFYMPATGDLFHAVGSQQAYLGEKEIRISDQGSLNNESLLLTYSRFHHRYRSAFPGKIRNLGCTSAHICYVAMGSAEGAVVFNESYQDLAAVGVIIEAAGGKIYQMDGNPFYLNDHVGRGRVDAPLIAASPEYLSQVLESLQEAA